MAKFKELKPQELEYLVYIYHEDMTHKEKMEILTKKFEVTARTIRRWWKDDLKLSEHFSTLPTQLKVAQKREINKKTNILLVTSAQNKTGINNKFLDNLVIYKNFLEEKGFSTEIVVAPARYRNPTSPTESDNKKSEMWWTDEVIPYLHYGKIKFGDTTIATDSRIRPTAKDPLVGYEVLAKDTNLVLPHSKIHFRTLPRFKGGPLRTMSTTGYISNKNYSDSKAGETAHEHHAYGFVVIEKNKDGVCHIPRNVKVKSDGTFIDMIYSVENEKVTTIKDSEGFVWGDIHEAQLNKDIFLKTLDLYNVFKPKQTILHDVIDFESANPHEVKDMYIQKKKIREGRHLISNEVESSFELVQSIKDTGSKINISLSNHDVFLDRLINDGNWKKDLHNSETYLKYAYIQQTEDIEKYGTIYGYLLHEKFGEEVNYMNYGDSLRIEGYECALHADNGTNGARGNYKTFSRLNIKMIGGHSHSPVMHNGYTGVGVTCKLSQYYTRKGLSSWAHAHTVIHGNGKNQLLVFGDDYKITNLI